MTTFFDRIDALPLIVVALAMLVTAVVVLAILWRQAEADAAEQRKRGDEYWCWAELHRSEADAARERLHVLERRHTNLQEIYANLVRRRLAASFPLIERNTKRQRRR